MTREEYEAEHGADVDIDYERDRTYCAHCDEEIEPGDEYYRGFLEFGCTVCVHKGCFKEYIARETTPETLADLLGFLPYTKEN